MANDGDRLLLCGSSGLQGQEAGTHQKRDDSGALHRASIAAGASLERPLIACRCLTFRSFTSPPVPSRRKFVLGVAEPVDVMSGMIVAPDRRAGARAAGGHVAAPRMSVMNSRRFTQSPHRRGRAATEALRDRAPWRS